MKNKSKKLIVFLVIIFSATFFACPLNYDHTLIDDYAESGSFNYRDTTFNGKTTVGTGNPYNYNFFIQRIIVSTPTVQSFNADGFFFIQGSVDFRRVYDYAMIKVTLISDPDLYTYYYIQGDFSLRIWLRFGAGDYKVDVIRFDSLNVELEGEGDITGTYYYYPDSPDYTFYVKNTNTENGRYIYPSGPIQADYPGIISVAENIKSLYSTDLDKIQAIHDYMTGLLSYDNDSLIDGQRKKQDAAFSWINEICVCEGYANLFAALSRAAGLTTKYIFGTTGTGALHAWNNIYYNSAYKLVDVTWDDSNSYELYLLLDSLTGIDNDHRPDATQPERGIIAVPKMPGYPDGWY